MATTTDPTNPHSPYTQDWHDWARSAEYRRRQLEEQRQIKELDALLARKREVGIEAFYFGHRRKG